MPLLYNKEFSVNFEPSSFDNFFIPMSKCIYNDKKKQKERAGEPALSKPSYMGLFLETA